MKNGFFRGHGLGNDYVVMDPKELSFSLTPRQDQSHLRSQLGSGQRRDSCSRPVKESRLRPDESSILTAAKRKNPATVCASLPAIFTPRARRKKSISPSRPKAVLVTIALHVDRHGDASAVTVEMGRATFHPAALPCTLTTSELIEQPIAAAGQSLTFTGVSVGNPHCVVFKPAGQSWSREDLLKLGPALENHALFPKRTNVQLAVPTGPKELFILIWERGAGETQASGSSSCAAASAAIRLGLVRSPVTVKMPGGQLNIQVAQDFSLTMKGPVAEVARGTLSPSFVRGLR